MFVQMDGAHHAPVDVAISACDWGGVRLEEHHHHYCHPHCYWGGVSTPENIIIVYMVTMMAYQHIPQSRYMTSWYVLTCSV